MAVAERGGGGTGENDESMSIYDTASGTWLRHSKPRIEIHRHMSGTVDLVDFPLWLSFRTGQ